VPVPVLLVLFRAALPLPLHRWPKRLVLMRPRLRRDLLLLDLPLQAPLLPVRLLRALLPLRLPLRLLLLRLLPRLLRPLPLRLPCFFWPLVALLDAAGQPEGLRPARTRFSTS
jgi:hypothetical protein